MQQHCAIAASNLRIAQHRDTLRYRKMRSGLYQTMPTKFSPGDLIYVRRPNAPHNLQSVARNAIYRIKEVRASGTLVVHGKCGTTMEVHSTHCAPCHLANINPAINSELATIPAGHACELCGSPEREDVMLICDGCLKGYHLDCLDPPLDSVPAESPWCCTTCLQQGLTPAILDELLRKDQQEQGVDHPVLQDQQQLREDKAAAMEGQPVLLRVLEAGRAPISITGKLKFIPREEREFARRPLLLEQRHGQLAGHPGVQGRVLHLGLWGAWAGTQPQAHLSLHSGPRTRPGPVGAPVQCRRTASALRHTSRFLLATLP